MTTWRRIQDLLRPKRGHGRGDSASFPSPLASLGGIDPVSLARALAGEHPQTTALVLLHLPPARSARVLTAIDEMLRPEIVRRMATIRRVRVELLAEVAASIQERLIAEEVEHAAGTVGEGLEGTAAILANLGHHELRRILEHLEREEPERVVELRNRIERRRRYETSRQPFASF